MRHEGGEDALAFGAALCQRKKRRTQQIDTDNAVVNEGGIGMNRRIFITGLSALGFLITAFGTLCASPAEGSEKKKSPLEALPGKIESFEHPCGKLKVNFVELKKDVPLRNGKLDAGTIIGEVESEGIRSKPIILAPEQANVIRAAMANPSAHIDQIPLLLVSARILRPEHIRLLHDPTLREGQIDILSQQGFNRLDKISLEGPVQTDVNVKKANGITPGNCIYTVYKGVPLVLGLNLDLMNSKDDMRELNRIAQSHRLTFSELADYQAKAIQAYLDAKNDFMEQKTIEMFYDHKQRLE